MSLRDLTDPEAVLAAFREFDRLGRDEFLRIHGFGRATTYSLYLNGQYYESKAIAGVAHAYQHPELGPLRSGDFHGGADTVERKLHNLGFEVRRGPQRMTSRNYWTLCADPNRYRILDAVNELEEDTWATKDHDLAVDDRLIIWQTSDRGGHRGIVALGEVVTEPEVTIEEGNPYWINREGIEEEEEERVYVRYVLGPNLPVWLGSSEHDEFLSSLNVARARGGSVFHVTPDQWDNIQEIVGGWPSTPNEVDEIFDQIRGRDVRVARGQGMRGLSGPERRVVENWAMECAISHFEQHWETITDISAIASYDLLCRTGDIELHVEVKGTTSSGESILLTRNEIAHARRIYPHVALFVVSHIDLDRTDPSAPSASGGQGTLYEPWAIDEHELSGLVYECKLN